MGASIIEIQNGITVTPIPHYTAAEVQNRTALAAWYTKCGVAVNSGVQNHAIVLLSDDGTVIRRELFNPPAAQAEE